MKPTALALLLLVAGCSHQQEREQAAIQTVFQAVEAAQQANTTITKIKTNLRTNLNTRAFADQLLKLDTTACPADFQVSYRTFAAQFSSAANYGPADSAADALNIFATIRAGQPSHVQAIERYQALQTSWTELLQNAQRHGVKFD